jgi:OmpA-OmpF porin, OOP family
MRLTAVVIAVLVGVILLSLWGLQTSDPYEPIIVQELGGIREWAPRPTPLPIASANAAPLVTVVEPTAASLFFEFDRAVLQASEAAKLDKVIDVLRAKGLRRLEAVGHADRIGDAQYNLRLSERRAEAVKAYLVEKKIDAGAVQTSALGEREPMSGDACVDMGPERRGNARLLECLQADRRVELTWR